ncbi:MAG TPA: SdpI family protein [Telluria sp.]|nr:SdpI family protein [Telluria sp.]
MKTSKLALCILMMAAAVAATLWFYPALPAQVPTHWNIDGKVDNVGPRWIVWLLGPGLMLFMFLLAYLLPRISPKRFEIAPFKPTFEYFIVVLVAVTGYFYAVTLASMVGSAISMQHAIPAGVFVLLILLGNPMGKVQPNFYVGIRTPWSLASPRVWRATHRLAGQLMVASGLLGLLAIACGAPFAVLMTVGVLWALVAVLYSLLHYKRLQRAGMLDA